jgi:tetratricopeptide (TPR) repeat protein
MRGLLLYAGFILVLQANAQEYADRSFYLIDSLILEELSESDRTLLDTNLAIYHRHPKDTLGILALDRITDLMMSAEWVRYNDFMKEKLDAILKESMPRSKEIFYKNRMAGILNNIGVDLWYRGNTAGALEHYNLALSIQRETGNQLGEAWTLNNVAQVHEKRGEIIVALDTYFEIEKIQKARNDHVGLGNSYTNIAHIYSGLDEIEKSVEFYELARTHYKKGNDPQGVARSLAHLASKHIRSGDTASALIDLRKAEQGYRKLGDKGGMVGVLRQLGSLQTNEDSALQFYREALLLAVNTKDIRNIANCYIGLAKILFKVGNKESLPNAQEGLEVALQSNSPSLIYPAALLMSQIQASKGNWKEAFEMRELAADHKDKINNDEFKKAAVRSQFKFEFEQEAIRDSLAHVEQLQAEEAAREKASVALAFRNRIQISGVTLLVLLMLPLIMMSGRLRIGRNIAQGLIFVFFILLFEFVLVIMDPWVESWSSGQVGIKLTINMSFALVLYFGHHYFAERLKAAIIKN